MWRVFFSVIFSVFLIFSCSVKNNKTSNEIFKADAESLIQYEVPEWYADAKLGYWVTWGLYSVPAFAGDHAAEWYGRWMYTVDDGSEAESGPGFEKRLWQNDTSLGLKSWSYAPDEEYRSPDQVEYGGKDIRFTRSKDSKKLYVIFLGWPGEKATIPSLAKGSIDLGGLKKLIMLDQKEKLNWSQDEHGLHLDLPKDLKKDAYAYAFSLEFRRSIPELTYE